MAGSCLTLVRSGHVQRCPLYPPESGQVRCKSPRLLTAQKHTFKVAPHRQNGLTFTKSAYAFIAAVMAGSMRASSRPVERPAAKTRFLLERRLRTPNAEM